MSEKFSENSYYIYVVVLIVVTSISACLILQERNFNFSNAQYNNSFLEFDERVTSINDTFDVIKFQRQNAREYRNSEGYKDTEWNVTKEPGTKRIVAIGDSMTQGPFVKLENIWASRLEEKLNSDESLKNEYEVLNMGKGGIGFLEKLEIFKNESLRYDPDFLILQYFGNDAWQDRINRKGRINYEKWKKGEYDLDEETKNKIEENDLSEKEVSKLFYFLQREAVKKKLAEGNLSKKKLYRENVKKPLLEIINITEEENIDMVVLGARMDKWGQNNLSEILEKRGIPLLSLSSVLDYEKTTLPDGHPNSEGHDLIARKVKKSLKERYLS